jgi:hypothetical protein
MNWKLIFLLSLFGLAMGIATVYVVPSNVEPFFWLAIMIVSAVVIARYAGGRYFTHGFLVSILNSLWITAIHAALFYTYVASHPEYMQMIEGLPPVLAAHPRRMMLVTGPIAGILSGIVLGLLSWIASKLFRRTAVA